MTKPKQLLTFFSISPHFFNTKGALKKPQVQRRIYDVLGVLEVVGVVIKRYKPKVYCLNPLAFEISKAEVFARKTLQKVSHDIVVVAQNVEVEENIEQERYRRDGPRFPTPRVPESSPGFSSAFKTVSRHKRRKTNKKSPFN